LELGGKTKNQIIMGLFNRNSKDAVREELKASAYKISIKLSKIIEELSTNGQQITLSIRGVAMELKEDVKSLEKLIKPTGRTDWHLVNNTKIQLSNGEIVEFMYFEARVNNLSKRLEEMTGVTTIEQMRQSDSLSFRIWT
jgi:hypothetical protein